MCISTKHRSEEFVQKVPGTIFYRHQFQVEMIYFAFTIQYTEWGIYLATLENAVVQLVRKEIFSIYMRGWQA